MGRRICAWCGKDLGPAAQSSDTHGVCSVCLKEQLARAKEARRQRKKEEKE